MIIRKCLQTPILCRTVGLLEPPTLVCKPCALTGTPQCLGRSQADAPKPALVFGVGVALPPLDISVTVRMRDEDTCQNSMKDSCC